MANPYVVNSRLTQEEVEKLVFNLANFATYRKIAATMGLSIQGLRPLLNRIERRMYFEIDWWPLFHLLQLSKYNPNVKQRPYNNHLIPMLEIIQRIPRNEDGKGLKIEGQKVNFEDEVACLYSCPQHPPPIQFVEKYGKAKPIGAYKAFKAQTECHSRIALKASCRSCKSKLIDIWTAEKRPHIFRFAMEYCERFGKPRRHNEDIYIARLAYYLVWRGYDMNVDEFLGFSPIRHQAGTGKLRPELRERYIREGFHKDQKQAAELKMKAIAAGVGYVMADLRERPIRVDRRGNYNA